MKPQVAPQAEENPNNADKVVVFKNCAPFTGCISEINNTQIDNARDMDAVIPMYSLIEYNGIRWTLIVLV